MTQLTRLIVNLLKGATQQFLITTGNRTLDLRIPNPTCKLWFEAVVELQKSLWGGRRPGMVQAL